MRRCRERQFAGEADRCRQPSRVKLIERGKTVDRRADNSEALIEYLRDALHQLWWIVVHRGHEEPFVRARCLFSKRRLPGLHRRAAMRAELDASTIV